MVGVVGAVLIAGGGSAIGVAATSQHHAREPAAAHTWALGLTGPTTPSSRGTATTVEGLILPRSLPVSIDIPAIEVHSVVQQVGLNPDGTIQVPPLNDGAVTNEAAWYKYSPTPGEIGPSIIEGHIDSATEGPSVFFHLGALTPGDQVDITLQDGTVAVFQVDGVREYPKTDFPTQTVYGNIPYAGLRLLTCGGNFDPSTGHYLSNIVVFASLMSSHPSS